MGNLIDRQVAIDNFIADKDAWEYYGIEYQGKKYIQFDDVIEELKTLPSVQSEHGVIRCKDCKHRPIMPKEYENGFSLEFPDNVCPCQCDDGWYNQYPTDDWFCANGEAKMEEGDAE